MFNWIFRKPKRQPITDAEYQEYHCKEMARRRREDFAFDTERFSIELIEATKNLIRGHFVFKYVKGSSLWQYLNHPEEHGIGRLMFSILARCSDGYYYLVPIRTITISSNRTEITCIGAGMSIHKDIDVDSSLLLFCGQTVSEKPVNFGQQGSIRCLAGDTLNFSHTCKTAMIKSFLCVEPQ